MRGNVIIFSGSVIAPCPGCIQITESDVRSHDRGPQRAGPHAGGEPQAGERHHGHAGGEQRQARGSQISATFMDIGRSYLSFNN